MGLWTRLTSIFGARQFERAAIEVDAAFVAPRTAMLPKPPRLNPLVEKLRALEAVDPAPLPNTNHRPPSRMDIDRKGDVARKPKPKRVYRGKRTLKRGSKTKSKKRA